MNIFRLLGDLSHVISFGCIIFRLLQKRSAYGISLKTQELYLIVFLARYLDLFTTYISLYNTSMKILYIVASGYIVYLLRYVQPFRSEYRQNKEKDSCNHIMLGIVPAAVLAVIFNEGNFGHWHGVGHYALELLWAFSEYLEAVAILPQLIMLRKDGSAENITSYYVASLGLYRLLYVINWVYRWYTEPHYSQWIAWVAGSVQTALYFDFFYYFALSKAAGMKHVILPGAD